MNATPVHLQLNYFPATGIPVSNVLPGNTWQESHSANNRGSRKLPARK